MNPRMPAKLYAELYSKGGDEAVQRYIDQHFPQNNRLERIKAGMNPTAVEVLVRESEEQPTGQSGRIISNAEIYLAEQLDELGPPLTPYVRELRFAQGLHERPQYAELGYKASSTSRYAFDFAWPELKVALEVESSGHRTQERFHSDMRKYSLAALEGWRVLRYNATGIKAGLAVAALRVALEVNNANRQ